MSSKARRIEKRLAELGERDVRFGGRTLEIRVYVNTDESIELLAERLRRAAVGPEKRMALLAGRELDGDEVRELWKLTSAAVDAQVAKSVDEEN